MVADKNIPIRSALRGIDPSNLPLPTKVVIANARAIDASAMAMLLQLVLEPIVREYIAANHPNSATVKTGWDALRGLIDDHIEETARISKVHHE